MNLLLFFRLFYWSFSELAKKKQFHFHATASFLVVSSQGFEPWTQ